MAKVGRFRRSRDEKRAISDLVKAAKKTMFMYSMLEINSLYIPESERRVLEKRIRKNHNQPLK
jgi:hypothetical protein